jgi:peptidyl-prolyl cis-trans isomerase B (cyclophilin B)
MGALTGCAGPVGAVPSPGGADTDAQFRMEAFNVEEEESESMIMEFEVPAMPAPIIEGHPGGHIFESGDLDLLQNTLPQSGDTIVILHTNMGDITMRFFPEETPMAYENFVTHARNGYYDGVIFHRVIDGFMLQGGDPEGTGMGGESIWGHGFPHEYSSHLRHFRGAVAMAHAQPSNLGSQFYIVQNTALDFGIAMELEWAWENQDFHLGTELDGREVYISDVYSKAMLEAYFRYGGTPFLDSALNEAFHTVFAQVIEGMDVVDAIAATETGAGDRPVEEVVIISVTVTTY